MSSQERAPVRAPEIQGGSGWLNTNQPLALAALKGKVVLLDFWTYGCINWIDRRRDLNKIQYKCMKHIHERGIEEHKMVVGKRRVQMDAILVCNWRQTMEGDGRSVTK